MNKINLILLIAISLTLTGCIFIYPIRVVEPLTATVIDANTGTPIEGATVLRIVCDLHDSGCKYAFIEKTTTNEKGLIDIDGDRDWGPWAAVPGGLPAPNHQIAIWKQGYYAFIFSQYNKDIYDFTLMNKNNKKILKAISEIPKEKKYLSEDINPYDVFNNVIIKLHKLK